FLGVIFLCEKLPFANSYEEKLVIYDRIDLITPENRQEMIEDLRKRLGLDIVTIQIGAVDFLRDTAMVKIFYRDKNRYGDNTVNKMLKLPKENS
ncbi:MAG: DUF4956 domain-containing protein, partial [Muribaculaceae bacterium]|nr:DUF4956 domain-containing protein [Muribaculaceae bacterium]